MSELFVLTERPSVYLASKSPRRQELLRQLGVEFDELLLREAPGRRRDIVEASRGGEPALEYVKRIARLKASLGRAVVDLQFTVIQKARQGLPLI